MALGFLAVLASGPWSVDTAARAQDLDLAEVERRALEQAPALAAERARVEAFRVAAPGAGRFDDPRLDVEVMDLAPTSGRPLDARVIFRQPLPSRGLRASERAVASAETEAAAVRLVVAERTLRADVRRAWSEVWSLQEERRLLEEAHPLFELVVESATARVAGGEPVRSVLEGRYALRRHEAMQEDVDARWLQAQSRLAEIAGFPAGGYFPRLGELPGIASPEPDLADAAASSPRVVAAERAVELAVARVEVERRGLGIGGSIGAGVRGMEGGSTELVVSGGIELPFFRRARVEPRIAAAESMLSAARAEVERERQAVRGELERLYLERIRIERQLVRIDEGTLREARAAFEAERSALLGGQGTVPSAARALGDWVETQIERARLTARRFATRASILSLLAQNDELGVEP